MKQSYCYTSKIKFIVINEWFRSKDITLAREAVENIPSVVSCYRWIREATSAGPACNSVRFNKTVQRKAVRMYYRKNRNASQVARIIGTTPTTVLRWVKQTSTI